ncbi:MAG: hypothetical protein WD055_01885 [Candidatus Dependentiae bacterium]
MNLSNKVFVIFFSLMTVAVEAAFSGPLSKVARTAGTASRQNVLGFLQYRQSLSQGRPFVNSDKKGDPVYVSRASRFVDGQLAKHNVAFDPKNDSPEQVVKALEPKKVEALDRHLLDMQLDYSAD